MSVKNSQKAKKSISYSKKFPNGETTSTISGTLGVGPAPAVKLKRTGSWQFGPHPESERTSEAWGSNATADSRITVHRPGCDVTCLQLFDSIPKSKLLDMVTWPSRSSTACPLPVSSIWLHLFIPLQPVFIKYLPSAYCIPGIVLRVQQ